MEDEGLALGDGETSQGPCEQDGLLMTNGLLARRRLIGGEPRAQAGGRGFQTGFERANSGDIAFLPPLGADGVGEVSREDRSKPCRSLTVVSATELLTLLIGLKQCLLHQIRGINPVIMSRSSELHPSQKSQVIPESLQTGGIREVACVHQEIPAMMMHSSAREYPIPGMTSKNRDELKRCTPRPERAPPSTIIIGDGFRDKNLSLAEQA